MARPQQQAMFQDWGVFSSDGPKRCYAVSEPAGRRGSGGALFVSFWPGAGNRARPSVMLRSDPRPGSAILLTVGDQRFQLVARGREAAPAAAGADAAIVAAMRRAASVTVTARSVRGAMMRDDYGLTGFPSALDAAALACARW